LLFLSSLSLSFLLPSSAFHLFHDVLRLSHPSPSPILDVSSSKTPSLTLPLSFFPLCPQVGHDSVC